MDNKRIVFFLGSMGRGGAERVISILSKEYANNGWSTDICILLFPKVDYEIKDTTRIFDLTGEEKSRIRRVPYWLKSIRNYIKNEKPDVIISFSARINILVILASLGLHKKIIVSERNDPRFDGRGHVIDVLTKIFYPKVDKVVFQTKRAKTYFSKEIQENSIIIPNPITVEKNAIECNSKKIVTVGRLTSQKNQKILIQAFAEVSKLYTEYTLHLFGQGELKEELVNQSQELKIDDKVFFEGNILNIHEQIADAELFILSSDYEGLSNALLEALMMGLPCIATNCAGTEEYITNMENGLIIPVGDAEELKGAMIKLIENIQLRKGIAKAASIRAKEFSTENVIKKWYQITE